MADPHALREPKQARSRQTTERVLDALEDLLKEKRFESITIRELLKRSKTSAGSFYARFPTRESLLPALYDRHDAQLHQSSPAHGRGPIRAPSLRVLCDEMTRRMVRRQRERRWFARAVALHARTHPEMIPVEQRQRRQAVHARWHEALLRFRDEINHSDPDLAVRVGLFVVVSACREKVVFGEAPLATSIEIEDEKLARELSRILWTYLTTEGDA